MEIYNATAKTKSGILRVTKSIGGLVVKSDQTLTDLANEKITAHIERANGTNEEIATNISLLAFICSSVFGEGYVIDSGSAFSAVCELGNEGSIPLGENENLVISLTDLKSAKTYELHGLETPVQSDERVYFAEKVFLSGQKQRSFEVHDFDEAVILGDFTKIRLTYATDEGSITIEHTKDEIRAISADIGLLRAGNNAQISTTCLSVVGVTDLEIFANNQVNIVLRDINKL